jgi:hypothetical protein
MRIVSIILFLGLVMSGCDKKSDFFMFDCTVYDDKLDAPVSGAQVSIFVQRIEGGFNTNYQLVGEATTDAQGRFYIEIEKDVFYSYRIDISDADHFSASYEVNPDNVPFSHPYSATFSVEPKAWVATHFINQNFSSTATFAVLSDNDNCMECCSGNNTIVQGFPIDSVFVCPVYGDQQITVSGNYVDMNGGVNQILQTAFVQAFDTTTVTVVY